MLSGVGLKRRTFLPVGAYRIIRTSTIRSFLAKVAIVCLPIRKANKDKIFLPSGKHRATSSCSMFSFSPTCKAGKDQRCGTEISFGGQIPRLRFAPFGMTRGHTHKSDWGGAGPAPQGMNKSLEKQARTETGGYLNRFLDFARHGGRGGVVMQVCRSIFCIFSRFRRGRGRFGLPWAVRALSALPLPRPGGPVRRRVVSRP